MAASHWEELRDVFVGQSKSETGCQCWGGGK